MIPMHIARTFAILRAAYPRWYAEMSVESLAAWGAMLADIDAEALQRAAVQFARATKWPPSVADLIQLARGDLSIEDQAQLALRHVKACALQELQGIALEALVATGGSHWPSHFRSGRYTSDQVAHFESSFLRVYTALARRDRLAAEASSASRISELLVSAPLPEIEATAKEKVG